MCKTAQLQYVRLKKKLEKFKMEKESWVSKKKKNQITSHLMDDAVILVSNLCYITIVLIVVLIWLQNYLGPGGDTDGVLHYK